MLIKAKVFSNTDIDKLCKDKYIELKLKREAEVFITHLKPGEMELTLQEINSSVHGLCPKMLLNNQEFEF